MDAEPPGKHPLDDRFRVLERHVEDLLDVLALVERRAGKHEMEIEALTGQMCEITGSIRDMLAARLRRDSERDEDRRILRRLILSAVTVSMLTILGHAVLAWVGSSRAVRFLDLNGMFPQPHSSELPSEAGGRAP